MSFQVKLLSESAKAPTRGSKGAAGYDLYAAKDMVILPLRNTIVPTDITVAIPEGFYGRVASRSSLSAKNQVEVGAGVIDSDYRGPVGVVLYNHCTENEFVISRGDRIAQLIITQIITPEVEVVDELDSTNRGTGGFGSTGK